MPTATDTRARLLVAARQAFADLGYGRARVEDVVARAGVGHGTFYAYFASKEEAVFAKFEIACWSSRRLHDGVNDC